MAKQSDKGPFVAQGASPDDVKAEARAKVLELLSVEVAASVPKELVLELVELYLMPGGVGVTEARALLTPIVREAWKGCADRLVSVVRAFREIGP